MLSVKIKGLSESMNLNNLLYRVILITLSNYIIGVSTITLCTRINIHAHAA